MERYRLRIHQVEKDKFAFRVVDSFTENILATCRRSDDCEKIVNLLNNDYLNIEEKRQLESRN